MFERSVSREDVAFVLENGETIESYPMDKPYPSRLVLAFHNNRPLHVVVADNVNENTIIVITVYQPDTELWHNDFKTRRGDGR
jgi:hypothetical protein